MEIPWVEKYRPKRLDQLRRDKSVEILRSWAKKWEEGIPEKRGLLIYGPPGTGKTSAAIALANEMGWDYIEFNASDVRSRSSINDTALRGSLYSTISEFAGRKKLIVLDEVDSLYERNIEGADVGGKAAISNLLERTMNPVILIANNVYDLKYGTSGKSIVEKCEEVEFQRYRSIQILNVLRDICRQENIFCSHEKLSEIAENSNGDMRAAINDLQGYGDFTEPQERDITQNIFSVISSIIYKKDSFLNIKNNIINLGEDPNNFILYLLENVYPFTSNVIDYIKALENISKADLFLGRVQKRMNYTMWSYANDMMASIVFYNLKGDRYLKFGFPALIKRMSQLKKFRNIREDFAYKTGRYIHKSSAFMNKDTLTFVYQLMKRDEEIRKKLEKEAYLDFDEISSLDL